jgi:hypothetical protein
MINRLQALKHMYRDTIRDMKMVTGILKFLFVTIKPETAMWSVPFKHWSTCTGIHLEVWEWWMIFSYFSFILCNKKQLGGSRFRALKYTYRVTIRCMKAVTVVWVWPVIRFEDFSMGSTYHTLRYHNPIGQTTWWVILNIPVFLFHACRLTTTEVFLLKASDVH